MSRRSVRGDTSRRAASSPPGSFDPDAWGDADGDDGDASSVAEAADASGFELVDGETLGSVLAEYEAVAARTDALVTDLPDLGASQALPEAPWFEQGARWSARRVFLHIIAETSQHAGHADILREQIVARRVR